MAQGPRPLIRCEDVTLGYPGGADVLRAIDLEIREGDFLAILGPNGCGKTTLLRAILGLLAPRAGTVSWFGPHGNVYDDPLGVRPGYVPQRHSLDALYPFTTFEVVLMGRYGRIGAIARPGPDDTQAALQALADVGLAARADEAFRDLSGGQKQRALLARALCVEPRLLILDEPTNDLDLAGEASVMGLVTELQRSGRCSVVFVSHLMHVVAQYADRVAVFHEGRLHAGALAEVLTEERLSRIYGTEVTVSTLPDGRPAVVSKRIGGAAR